MKISLPHQKATSPTQHSIALLRCKVKIRNRKRKPKLRHQVVTSNFLQSNLAAKNATKSYFHKQTVVPFDAYNQAICHCLHLLHESDNIFVRTGKAKIDSNTSLNTLQIPIPNLAQLIKLLKISTLPKLATTD
jgi:hypothetical protein